MRICLLIAFSLVHLALSRPAEAADQFQVDEVVLQPGKMGMNVETLSPEQAADAGDPGLKGVRITDVTTGSPAEKLGLKAGDIIVQANSRPIVSHTEIVALLRDRLVGATTRLQIRRKADHRLVDVVVPSAPQPMLRIDAGMHNAPIRRIALDGNGRWLVTASEDKTAKVWDLATGRLARTLRPPLGDDNEGKLEALAISPNGTMVAVAGWTGMWGKTASVYLFDRTNGRLLRQLSGLPGMIEALAWSPDGNFLAISFAGQGGIYVYRTDNWTAMGTDPNYGGRVVGLDFNRSNQLVSASHDGFLRVYLVTPAGLKLLAKHMGPGGKQPTTARFSPNGALIAVGYADSTKVSVLAATNLDFVYAANTLSARNGDLRSVAWSSDGRTLFAAGRYVAGSRQVIRSWPDAGRGEPRDEPVAGNSIFDLQAMPGGGVVFGTAEPAWGILAANGQKRLAVSSPIADFRGGGEQLQVSKDGHRIRFGFERNGSLAADFDTEDGLVVSETNKATGVVSPAVMEFPGLVVSNWKNTNEPKLNGLSLRLRPGENSRSLAIAPDGQSVVLGSDWVLNKFDAAGKLLGRIATPGAAWAVNYSGDGRFLLAAFSDGTIRWYNAKNGQEKLALFAHSDRKRWVAWTPSGYYAASPAGEELIGWHINNGPDQAGDFYPASRFRAKFYRPDVLAKVLEAGTDIEALRLANQESGRVSQHAEISQALPPMIDPVSPAEAAIKDTTVTIRFRVRNVSDAPLQNIRVRVNGGNVPEARNLAVTQSGVDEVRAVSVKLPEQDSTVELFAENRNGVSTPATFRFVWQGARPPKPNLPTLYVLAIGVSNYRDTSIRLGYPAKDAKDFVDALKLQQGRLYADVQVVILTNEQATRAAVLENLATMKNRVKENDVGVLFIAGHGLNAKDGTYYYVPFDFDTKKPDSTGVVYSAIRGTLAEIPGRAILFIDTCHSGNVLGKTDLTAVINDLTARENNVVVFASSTQKETSQESDAWKNGAFTKVLVEGMRGGGDIFKDGKVMYTGLHAYLSRTVSAMTGNAQHPVVLPGGIEDFVVAIP
jgi:WD40 repeat protein